MSEAMTIALIAALGGLGAAGVTLLVHLMRRVARVEALNRRLWLALRAQIDHAYRSGIQPLALHDDLFGEDTA